jgi:hypothetical protein
MSLVKALIRTKDGSGEVRCAFNPTEYTVATGAEWRRTPTTGARSASPAAFVGTQPRTLRLRLLFDAWATDTEDVSGDIDRLLAWTNPTASSISQGQPQPPIVVFHWGRSAFFDAYISSVDAQYTLFSSDGVPLRATVTVALIEVPAEPARQNPTSGGFHGRRTAVLGAGESLHAIAHREYGDAALWRGLAIANGIDDPLGVAIGTTILVPPREEVAAVS